MTRILQRGILSQDKSPTPRPNWNDKTDVKPSPNPQHLDHVNRNRLKPPPGKVVVDDVLERYGYDPTDPEWSDPGVRALAQLRGPTITFVTLRDDSGGDHSEARTKEDTERLGRLWTELMKSSGMPSAQVYPVSGTKVVLTVTDPLDALATRDLVLSQEEVVEWECDGWVHRPRSRTSSPKRGAGGLDGPGEGPGVRVHEDGGGASASGAGFGEGESPWTARGAQPAAPREGEARAQASSGKRYEL